MKLGLVQYNPEWESVEKNKAKLNSLLSETREKVDLLIFPEMTLTGFTMKAANFAEEINGDSFKYFSSLAKARVSQIICGAIEKENDKLFNSLWHFNENGELQAKYYKIHPFSYSTEDKNYSAGLNTVVTEIKGIKTGLSICYDLRFPELYRLYAKQRVELIVIIANWPIIRIEHWRALLKARAIENQCYVAGVNRVGNDPGNIYNGFSGVYDPMGREIISVENEEKIIVVEINPEQVKDVRTKLPFLNDIKLI